MRHPFTLVAILSIAILGACSDSDHVSDGDDSVIVDSEGQVSVAVPRRIAESERMLSADDLRLEIVIEYVGVDNNQDGMNDVQSFDLTDRDRDGNATGSVQVLSGVPLNLSSYWWAQGVVIARNVGSIEALTDDAVYSIVGDWDYDLDEDGDNFTNFVEVDAGSDPNSSLSVPNRIALIEGFWDISDGFSGESEYVEIDRAGIYLSYWYDGGSVLCYNTFTTQISHQGDDVYEHQTIFGTFEMTLVVSEEDTLQIELLAGSDTNGDGVVDASDITTATGVRATSFNPPLVICAS